MCLDSAVRAIAESPWNSCVSHYIVWRLVWAVFFFIIFQKCLFLISAISGIKSPVFGVAGSEGKSVPLCGCLWCELASLTSVLEGSHPQHTGGCCSWHWVECMDCSLHLATPNAKKAPLLFVDRVHAFSLLVLHEKQMALQAFTMSVPEYLKNWADPQVGRGDLSTCPRAAQLGISQHISCPSRTSVEALSFSWPRCPHCGWRCPLQPISLKDGK